MAYQVKYRRAAKEEADYFRQTYGAQFRSDFDAWLRSIAAAAERGDETGSLDVSSELDRLRRVWEKFKVVGATQKVLALLTALRRRGLPWDFRTQSAWFPLLDGIAMGEIQAYFEIDHPQQCVVFTLFDMLDTSNDDSQIVE